MTNKYLTFANPLPVTECSLDTMREQARVAERLQLPDRPEAISDKLVTKQNSRHGVLSHQLLKVVLSQFGVRRPVVDVGLIVEANNQPAPAARLRVGKTNDILDEFSLLVGCVGVQLALEIDAR